MDDADVESAVDAARNGVKVFCWRVVCTCNDRMYLHRNIYDEFMDKVLEESESAESG